MDWVPVGRVTRAHGLKGELKFHLFVYGEQVVRGFRRVLLGDEPGQEKEFQIESIRGKGAPFIIKFKGVNSVDEVKPLMGQTVYAAADDFKRLPEGKFYWFEVEGLSVYDEERKFYGTIEELIQTGSNDVYVVREGNKELLLPVIDSVVKSVDLKNRKLIFHAIEGLVEDALF